MRKSLLPEKYHTIIYIFALILLVIGMPLSKFLMSLSQFILIFNWLLEGGLKNKLIAFKNNKAALIASSILLLHLIGLLYTSDFAYAFKDIRIKAPLLILPLILSTSKPLEQKVIDVILQFFVSAILVATLVSTLILTGIVQREIIDIRSISIFISHIRFALLICVAIFISGYFYKNTSKIQLKALWVIILLWLIVFLVLMESITGLVILSITILIIAGYAIASGKNIRFKLVGLFFFALIGMFIFSVSKQINKITPEPEKIDISKLEYFTSRGNPYIHEFNSKLTENGHLIWMYFSNEELQESWNKRSKIKFSEKDLKGNPIRFTLIRFLASKGWRKDADAVESLSNGEIRAIERGIANVNYQNISSLETRLHEIVWELNEYKNSGDPSGHSFTQRFEFWKAAFGIIKNNLLIGVGTGDVPTAFEQQYIKMNSPLSTEWRLRSHNQYLAIAVAFGVIGLIWFLISLIYPMIRMHKTLDFLYISFLIIALISFLTEDTLETQAGVTFYAFFNAFFLFVCSSKKN